MFSDRQRNAMKSNFFQPGNLAQNVLLNVARGQEYEALQHLSNLPLNYNKTPDEIVLTKTDVTDYSGRVFDSISPIQMAAWALDTHMLRALLRALPAQHEKTLAAAQLTDLLHDGVKYTFNGEKYQDSHYDVDIYICALDTLIQNKSEWSAETRADYWVYSIGSIQRQVPANLAQEFCRTDRSFKSVPDFKEADFPRTFEVQDIAALGPYVEKTLQWYPLPEDDTGLGKYVAISRAWCDKATAYGHLSGVGAARAHARGEFDLAALKAYKKARLEELHDIVQELLGKKHELKTDRSKCVIC